MSSSPRPNRINVDLQEYKRPWIDYCKARGATPSEAFRQVVSKLTAGDAGAGVSSTNESAETDGKIRREIRLTRTELQQTEALAATDGFSLARWVVALIRVRLEASPQLGQVELELLARSNMHILAIGRNLNQIAKVLNSDAGAARALHADAIEHVRVEVMRHAVIVSGVLAANVQRWSAK